MKGTDFAKTLPDDITAREDLIVQAVRDGHAIITWYELPLAGGATVEVTADAIRIGEPDDALRVNLSATGLQRVADVLGASLLTSAVADDIHRYAAQHGTVLKPLQQGWWADGSMATTRRMVEQSRLVDEQLRKARATIPKTPVVSGQCKDFVLSARLNSAPLDTSANFGWHDPNAGLRSPSGLAVLQSVGLAHDRWHSDYSQGGRLMRKLRINGQLVPIPTALIDPTNHVIISDEGVITRTAMLTTPPRGAVKAPAAAVPPTIRKGSKGPAVARWQGILGITADGDFGSNTEAATKKWQSAHGLTADGIVGPKSWSVAAMSAGDAPDSLKKADVVKGSPVGSVSFIKAKHFRPATNRAIDLVVLHTAEVPENTTSAEAVASYFKNPIGPKGPVTASCHFCVDSDSVVQCVKEEDVAFAAPGANHNGIQIEMSGYAKQSPEDWADPYSTTMLRRVAQLTAALCEKYEIPVEFVDAAGLIRGDRGITTHAEVSKAFKQSTHVDPGKSFPMDAFLGVVAEF